MPLGFRPISTTPISALPAAPAAAADDWLPSFVSQGDDAVDLEVAELEDSLQVNFVSPLDGAAVASDETVVVALVSDADVDLVDDDAPASFVSVPLADLAVTDDAFFVLVFVDDLELDDDAHVEIAGPRGPPADLDDSLVAGAVVSGDPDADVDDDAVAIFVSTPVDEAVDAPPAVAIGQVDDELEDEPASPLPFAAADDLDSTVVRPLADGQVDDELEDEPASPAVFAADDLVDATIVRPPADGQVDDDLEDEPASGVAAPLDDAGAVADASIIALAVAVDLDDLEIVVDEPVSVFVPPPIDDTIDALPAVPLAGQVDDELEDEPSPAAFAFADDLVDATVVRPLADGQVDDELEDEPAPAPFVFADDLVDGTIVRPLADGQVDDEFEDEPASPLPFAAADDVDATILRPFAGRVDDELEDEPAPAVVPFVLADAPSVDDEVVAPLVAPADPDDELERDRLDERSGGIVVASPAADRPTLPSFDDVAYLTLKAWLIANWSATALRFENELVDPPADLAPFVFFEMTTELVDVSEIGAGTAQADIWREQGEAFFHVLVASGTGALEARGFAEDLAHMMKGLALANGVRIGSLSIGAGEMAARDGNYWVLTLSAQWVRDDWR